MQDTDVCAVQTSDDVRIDIPRDVWQQFDLFRNAPSTSACLNIDVDCFILSHCIQILAKRNDAAEQRRAMQQFYMLTKNCIVATLQKLEYLQCWSVLDFYCQILLREMSGIQTRHNMQVLYDIGQTASTEKARQHADPVYGETNCDFSLLAALS